MHFTNKLFIMYHMINIQIAIDYFGSQAALAKALGVNSMAVTQWKKRGLPIIRALQIERCTKGSIKAEELLPDIFSYSSDKADPLTVIPNCRSTDLTNE